MNKKLIVMAILILGSLSITTLQATTVSKEQAVKKATQSVPKESKLVIVVEKGNGYEVKFYNESKSETYEVEISNDGQNIKEFKSEKIGVQGSNNVVLNEADIKKRVLKEYSNAKIISIQLNNDDGVKEYQVKLSQDNMIGEIEVNPQTGTIFKRDFEQIANQKVSSIEIAKNDKFISVEKAKEIALNKIPDALITEIKLDFELGKYIYEIEAYKNGYEYEIKLDAKTGKGLSLFKDLDDWYDETMLVKESSKIPNIEQIQKNDISDTIISIEKAKNIALEKVPGAKVIKIKQDYDNGISIYEVELQKGNLEYDLDIDARTGQILSMDIDD